MTDTTSQAAGFQQVRDTRRNELVEDYVELIADLLDESGEARQVDIAQRLGVAPPTVAKVLRRLEDDRLVTRRSYRGIFLTQAGRDMAEANRHRHRVVELLLKELGVPEAAAVRDSEGIEHHVSQETLAAFERFLEVRGAS